MAGSFDLDDYIDYLIGFLELIGERTGKRAHMLAVCQPAVPAFAATALMAEDKNKWRPKTLTMMGGPIDTRKAPTAVNTLATRRPHTWFQNPTRCWRGTRSAGAAAQQGPRAAGSSPAAPRACR